MSEISAFSLSILDQIRLRHLMADRVNPAIAASLEARGWIEAVEGLNNDAASALARRTGHFRWRITDAGVAQLGKTRVW